MVAIVCFDLVPEALEISGIALIILGILFGVISMIICDILVQKKFNTKIAEAKINNQINNTKTTNSKTVNSKSNTLLKTGIIVSIGLALHNFPEGLSIRSRFWGFIKTWVFVSPSNTIT